MGVSNPTSILHKDVECARVEADLLFLSETSIMTPSLRARGLSVIWGSPVPPHESEAPAGSLGGHASGVAILSAGEIHKPVPHMPASALDTTRLVEAMVRFGPIEVRAIAVYGYPRNRSGHLDMNQELLSMAMERVCASAIPTILGGDPIWMLLSSLYGSNFGNWDEAFAFVRERLGQELPATCKGSTRFDTFLVPTFLQPYLCKAEVMQADHLFDAHSPLVLTFSLPRHYPAGRCPKIEPSVLIPAVLKQRMQPAAHSSNSKLLTAPPHMTFSTASENGLETWRQLLIWQ